MTREEGASAGGVRVRGGKTGKHGTEMCKTVRTQWDRSVAMSFGEVAAPGAGTEWTHEGEVGNSSAVAGVPFAEDRHGNWLRDVQRGNEECQLFATSP